MFITSKISFLFNKNKNNYFFILFFFFLFLYSLIFVIGVYLDNIPNYCVSDECRYFENVHHLLKGTYQNPLTERLVPPMHSIYIGPIVLLDLGRRFVVYLNLIISCLTISLTYLTSRFYLSNKKSLIISIIYGFYFIKYEQDFTALTEPFTTFLVLFNLFLFAKYTFTQRKFYLLLSGILLGMLALQRPIFFYVLIAFLIISFAKALFNKKNINYFLTFILSFSITLPYQAFTFKKTGKFFFMSNISAETIYWMSTPFKREYGDWQNENFDSNCQIKFNQGEFCNNQFYERNHGEFFDSIKELNMIEKNDALFKKGIQNIISNPFKYLRNIFSNISRLFFNYPGSYMYQTDKTILRLIPNSIILNLMIFSFFITCINIKRIPEEMIYSLFFIFFYLILSSLITAYARMFVVVVPYILIWIGYSVKIWKNSS